jgi:hypothetical protein
MASVGAIGRGYVLLAGFTARRHRRHARLDGRQDRGAPTLPRRRGQDEPGSGRRGRLAPRRQPVHPLWRHPQGPPAPASSARPGPSSPSPCTSGFSSSWASARPGGGERRVRRHDGGGAGQRRPRHPGPGAMSAVRPDPGAGPGVRIPAPAPAAGAARPALRGPPGPRGRDRASGEDAGDHVERLALEKARAVADRYAETPWSSPATRWWSWTARSWPSPGTRDDAVAMLLRLQGRTFTAWRRAWPWSLPDGREAGDGGGADVTFPAVRPGFRAGVRGHGRAHGQGRGLRDPGVRRRSRGPAWGDYYAVVGLPWRRVVELLERVGWSTGSVRRRTGPAPQH